MMAEQMVDSRGAVWVDKTAESMVEMKDILKVVLMVVLKEEKTGLK